MLSKKYEVLYFVLYFMQYLLKEAKSEMQTGAVRIQEL